MADVVTKATRLVWVILDGTLIPADQVGEDRPYFSGKHRRHGVNAQVLAGPFGHLLWVSPVLPGSTHDLTAARNHGIIQALTNAQITTWADRGYQSAGGTVSTPFKRRPGRDLSDNQRDVNSAHNAIRAKGERAIAVLKTWNILTKIRCDPGYTTAIPQGHHRAPTRRRPALMRLEGSITAATPSCTTRWSANDRNAKLAFRYYSPRS